MSKPALLTTGPMMSLIEEGIDKAFVVHRLQQASDREALAEEGGPRHPRHLHRQPHRREDRRGHDGATAPT